MAGFKSSVNFYLSLKKLGCQLWCCEIIFSYLLFILIFGLKKFDRSLRGFYKLGWPSFSMRVQIPLYHTRYQLWYSSSLVSKGYSLLSYTYIPKNRMESAFKHRWRPHLYVRLIVSFRSALLAKHATRKEEVFTAQRTKSDIARRTQIIRIKANMRVSWECSTCPLMFQSKDNLNSKPISEDFQHQKELSVNFFEKVRDLPSLHMRQFF